MWCGKACEYPLNSSGALLQSQPAEPAVDQWEEGHAVGRACSPKDENSPQALEAHGVVRRRDGQLRRPPPRSRGPHQAPLLPGFPDLLQDAGVALDLLGNVLEHEGETIEDP